MSPEKIPTRTRLALAQKLRFLRFTRGWSQEVLAELAGLHRTYISQIERGQVSAAPVLSSLSHPAPLESPGLAFRGLPVRRGEHSLDVRLFPPHPCARGPLSVILVAPAHPCARDISASVHVNLRGIRAVASDSCPLATLLLPCRASCPAHWPLRGRQAGQIQRRSSTSL